MLFTRSITLVTASLLICSPVLACMWDTDTLAVERRRFPSAHELISGKFLRHSRAYYEWRINDRKSRIETAPSPELYDDLAVAFDKIGNHDLAIQTALQKQELNPGLYETHANLGTFYIHSGQLEMGVEQIDLALELNPDAHFGREVYQKHLVNYLLSRRVDGETKLPLGSPEDYTEEYEQIPHVGFDTYLAENTNATDQKDFDSALKGVLGMLRFGNHDSPELLEAVGDLLLRQDEDAKRLAARAYLKASYAAGDSDTKSAYRKMASRALFSGGAQTKAPLVYDELPLSDIEASFAAEIEEADDWFQQVVADEARWIEAGVDVDAAYAQKYYRDPSLSSYSYLWTVAAIVCGVSVTALLWSRFRRKRQDTATAGEVVAG